MEQEGVKHVQAPVRYAPRRYVKGNIGFWLWSHDDTIQLKLDVPKHHECDLSARVLLISVSLRCVGCCTIMQAPLKSLALGYKTFRSCICIEDLMNDWKKHYSSPVNFSITTIKKPVIHWGKKPCRDQKHICTILFYAIFPPCHNLWSWLSVNNCRPSSNWVGNEYGRF